MDQIRLVSTYKGVHVPSMIFDSTGTKKIAAIASYVIEALEQGRILVVDELDSSIHFKLTRAIVAMFNNELNTSAQMIFTVHDINLMDCKRMFRKEQIWFVHKDEEGVLKIWVNSKFLYLDKTVLLLTHDFEPITDFIVVGKMSKDNAVASFVWNENGIATEQYVR